MIEMSATVTVGKGSERHNHDLGYRESLKHCHETDEFSVIELVPYEKTYKEQINEIMKPYIDEYNQKQEDRLKAAWDRYNAGKIKTKPRKRDYKKLDYDYYEDHLNDTRHNKKTNKDELVPIYRSLIIGIGDKEDRKKLSEDEASAIMKGTLEDIKSAFPCFRILGATLHLDEQGFYHMHLDYKPVYEREETKQAKGGGLSVGIGLDGALEQMGFKPEQSIMNSRDKVPLLFNAMRNKIYHLLEANMANYGVRMQYKVSERKEPGKDASKNQKLEDWQATQDKVRELQHEKNIALDIIENDEVDEEMVVKAIGAIDNVANQLNDVMSSTKIRIKNTVVVEFHLLDQLKSFVEQLKETFAYLFKKIDELTKKNRELDAENDELYYENQELKENVENHYISKDVHYKKCNEYENEINFIKKRLMNLENYILNHSHLENEHIEQIERGKNPDSKERTHHHEMTR